MNITKTINKIVLDKYLNRITYTKYNPDKYRINYDNADLCHKIFQEFIKEKYPTIKLDDTFTKLGTQWHMRYYFDKKHFFNLEISTYERGKIEVGFNHWIIFKFHNWAKVLNFLLYESDNYLSLIKLFYKLAPDNKHLTIKHCKSCGFTDFNFSHDDIYSTYYFNPKKDTKYYSKNNED